RAYCLKIQPATGSFARNLIYSTKPVSPFVTPNSEIKALIKNIHETWANIGYFLIAAHAGAALFHHYIQKDNTLLRMMPRRK
ncbi:cytochrome b/b6 domain-containing protein, partial [Escherichia coli]